MLRADMDALPIAENTGLAYASTVTATDAAGNVVPVGHMCGHDMHVAWLAGATALLAVRNLIAPLGQLAITQRRAIVLAEWRADTTLAITLFAATGFVCAESVVTRYGLR